MKLNYKIPTEALKIIDHLISNNDGFKLSVSNCRTFDACMQTIKKSIDELNELKKEKESEDNCPSNKN